jgi:N6-L-threonylcarbamoyladenine synthase
MMTDKQALARDFEDAVVEVLTKKLVKAIKNFPVNSVILGGGVSANNKLRHAVSALNSPQLFPQLEIYLPDQLYLPITV